MYQMQVGYWDWLDEYERRYVVDGCWVGGVNYFLGYKQIKPGWYAYVSPAYVVKVQDVTEGMQKVEERVPAVQTG